MTAEGAGLFLDYSKHRVTDETMRLLLDARAGRGRRGAADRDVRGRAHQHDRGSGGPPHGAARARPRARSWSTARTSWRTSTRSSTGWPRSRIRVRDGEWTGSTGKPIRNVINIGIGGSDLGPAMATEALRHYRDRSMRFRFVSNVDGADIRDATVDLDPAETLFIVSSQDVHDARDADQRPDRARLAGRRRSATRRRSRSTSSRS